MLQDLRRPVIRRDQDVWKGFVITEQHIKSWPQALDQIGFEQQRFGLGLCGHELQGRRRRDHAGDAAVVTSWPRVGCHPFLDVLGLANVEHVALRTDHAVYAWRGWSHFGEAQDCSAASRE